MLLFHGRRFFSFPTAVNLVGIHLHNVEATGFDRNGNLFLAKAICIGLNSKFLKWSEKSHHEKKE